MKLLGITKSKITKDKNFEMVRHLEITEIVLVHCNIIKNDHQQDLTVLYTFLSSKPFGQLLDTLTKIFMFLKTFNSNFLILKYSFLIKILSP